MLDQNVVHGKQPSFPLPRDSLGKILYETLSAREKSEVVFINEKTGECLTCEELLKNSCRLARSLTTHGADHNKIIGIASDNDLNNFTVVLACLYAGIPLTFINPKFTEHELQHILDTVQPYILFCTAPYYDKLRNLQSKNSYLKELILIDSDTKNIYCDKLDTFLNRYPETLENFKPVDVDVADHVAFILLSSGTTGLPKGVMLTHQNVIATLVYSLDCWNIPRDNGVNILVLPFFHTYGLHNTLLGLLQNRKIVILEKFEPETYLRVVAKYRIRKLFTVPPLVHFLLKSEVVDKYDLSCVEEVTCGAAPLSRDLEEGIKKKFNIHIVGQGYGMTELGLAIATPEGDERLGSIGTPVQGVSCVVKDIETCENVGPNRIGEICVKGAIVMKGYYRNEQATKEAFTKDGFLRTGDCGYFDHDGYFYIVDRIKELIKYKGFQVAPAELEQILLTNPKIQDAGVVGLPKEDVGELPLAFIVKKPGVNLTKTEVQQYLETFVSRNKYLRGGVIFIDEIPRNPSGKILRKILREFLTNIKAKL